jgi:hypothetical protein
MIGEEAKECSKNMSHIENIHSAANKTQATTRITTKKLPRYDRIVQSNSASTLHKIFQYIPKTY